MPIEIFKTIEKFLATRKEGYVLNNTVLQKFFS